MKCLQYMLENIFTNVSKHTVTKLHNTEGLVPFFYKLSNFIQLFNYLIKIQTVISL